MSIEKWKLEEKVRIANLKNRGDVLGIVADTRLPIEYIQRTLEKIKKRRERNVAVLISESLMTHILDGYEQRTRYLVEIMKGLENRDQVLVSVCCSVPVKVVAYPDAGRGDLYECIKCNKRCEAHTTDQKFIYDLKHKTIEMMRHEDEALTSFAVKMGFTNDKIPGVLINQNILMMNTKKRNTDPGNSEVVIDTDVARDIANLPMADREKLIKKIDRQIAGMVDEDTTDPDNGNGNSHTA